MSILKRALFTCDLKGFFITYMMYSYFMQFCSLDLCSINVYYISVKYSRTCLYKRRYSEHSFIKILL